MKQHTVPKFLLEGFVDPSSIPTGKQRRMPYLHVFDLESTEWKRKAPKNVATLRDYYEYPAGVDTRERRVFESTLSQVENRAARAIRRLDGRRIQQADRFHIALFVTAMVARHPFNHQKQKERIERDFVARLPGLVDEFIADEAKFDTFMREHAIGLDISPEELRQGMAQVQMDYPLAGLIADNIEAAFRAAPTMAKMGWEFLTTSDERPFISSDNPVSFYTGFPLVPAFGGFGLPGVQVAVALTRRCALLASRQVTQDRWRTATDAEVHAINVRTATQSIGQLFAPSRDFLGSEFYPPKSASIDRSDGGRRFIAMINGAKHLPPQT